MERAREIIGASHLEQLKLDAERLGGRLMLLHAPHGIGRKRLPAGLAPCPLLGVAERAAHDGRAGRDQFAAGLDPALLGSVLADGVGDLGRARIAVELARILGTEPALVLAGFGIFDVEEVAGIGFLEVVAKRLLAATPERDLGRGLGGDGDCGEQGREDDRVVTHPQAAETSPHVRLEYRPIGCIHSSGVSL